MWREKIESNRALLLWLSLTTLFALTACQGETSYPPPDRNEAKQALLHVAVLQERFYIDNQAYSDDLTQLDFMADPFVTESGSYVVDLTLEADGAIGVGGDTYSATASYTREDAETLDCQWLKIDSNGEKTSGPSTRCWRR